MYMYKHVGFRWCKYKHKNIMLILSLVLKQRSMVLYTYLFLNRPPLLTGNLLRVQYTVYVPERDHRMFPVSCVYNHYLISTTTVHISIKWNLLFQHVLCVGEFQSYHFWNFKLISDQFSLVVVFPQIKK